MPYDATTKELIETDPAGWVAFLGGTAPPSAVGMIDADLSTVTTATDKVIRVDEPYRWLLHLDIQTGSNPNVERRLFQYHALLHARHGVPVASAVVMLRKSGNMAWMNGRMPIAPPVGPAWEFRYEVIRVWERSASEFLNGPLGLIPLAPLAGVTDTELPAVVSQMKSVIDAQERSLAAKLWTATYVLMGLAFDEALIDNVLSGVRQMEESVTYQAIKRRGVQEGIQEGSAAEARKMLLIAGGEKFGPPSAEAEATVAAITDPTRFESLLQKLFRVATWDELLAE